MKVLILNSGMGSRMGDETKTHPKCMTEISAGETILSRQLSLLCKENLHDIIMTTGYQQELLQQYCQSLDLPLNFRFVFNRDYSTTNYIYSIYCAKEELLDDDIILMHGDLVFERSVLAGLISFPHSCVKISSSCPLPEKDFKAVLDGELVKKIGVEFFEPGAVEAQAFYKLKQKDWLVWLDRICEFCESGKRNCYAENAFNEISEQCCIYGYDAKDALCSEIDNNEDLERIKKLL